MSAPPIPIGARVFVSDRYYTGPAIVLDYDANAPDRHGTQDDRGGPYYCHLIDLCDHEMCPDTEYDNPDNDCNSQACRGWYSIGSEGQS
jgi:hypothetical protein